MATADASTIVRKVVTRPSASDSQPDRMRPPAFPAAVTGRASVATAAPRPALRAKGTSWLIVIWPAVAPSAYAIQRP